MKGPLPRLEPHVGRQIVHVVPDARDFAVQPRGYEAKDGQGSRWIMRILHYSSY